MSRMNRLSRIGVLGVAVTLMACPKPKPEAPTTADDVRELASQVQELKDSLEAEKARLRKYFEKPGQLDAAAWAYWSRLADAICDIEARTPGLPPVGNRMCPDDGGGPDKIAPPPYPPR